MEETLTTVGGFSLESTAWEVAPIHIPDNNETNISCYKTELTLLRIPTEKTVKIMWWHQDDPRQDMPHNHPWDFTSQILRGGYTDVRYWLDRHGQVQSEAKHLREGNENVVPSDVYHIVVEVLPQTTTRLECGPASEGNAWGYLDTTTARHIPFQEVDPTFLQRLRVINPHLRPRQ